MGSGRDLPFRSSPLIVLTRLVPVSVVEVLARLAGYVIGIGMPHGAYPSEQIIRGVYWRRRLGAGRRLLIGRHVQFEGARISLGSGVRLFDGGHYVTGSRGWITIGDRTHISRMSIISGLGGVDIGTNCAISAQVLIYSSSTNTKARTLGDGEAVRATVTIGNNVYIGAGVRIIPGVQIGDDAVVAAGAVVIRDVPPGSLARGVPAACSPLPGREDVP